MTEKKNGSSTPAIHRQCIRLTFRLKDGDMKILSHERVNKICPPAVGPRPEAGKNSGLWFELKDENDKVLFHKVLSTPLNSVEVFSPEGKIERVFADTVDRTFEVLLPDTQDSRHISLMGESDFLKEDEQNTQKSYDRAKGEIRRFDIPKGRKGGQKP